MPLVGAPRGLYTQLLACSSSQSVACEQALLFGRVKRVSRERASERQSREGQRKGELAAVQPSLTNFHLYFAQTKGNTIG